MTLGRSVWKDAIHVVLSWIHLSMIFIMFQCFIFPWDLIASFRTILNAYAYSWDAFSTH